MGLFDFLTGNKQSENKQVQRNEQGKIPYQSPYGDFAGANSTIDTFKPTSFEEVADIIDVLLSGRPAIVYLTEVKDSTAQRVIDLLSGATYAINGSMGEIQKGIYLFTPNGIRTN